MASAAALVSAGSSIEPINTRGGLLQGHTPTSPLEMGLMLFNENLTNDEAKKIGTTSTTINHPQQPCTLEDLLQEVTKLQESWNNDRSDAQRRVDTVITTIDQHARVIDVLIKQQPDITSLVWGAIRFLIGIAAKEIDTTEKISQSLIQILGSLARWNKYIELQIINFLVRAKSYYSKPRHARSFKVACRTYAQKFESIMSLIHAYDQALEQEASLAAEIRRAEDRKAQKEQFDIAQKEIAKQDQFRSDLSHDVRGIRYTFEDDQLRRDTTTAIEWLKQSQCIYPVLSENEEGTGTWIQRSEQWNTWEANINNKPLCICGPPGAGKSTIANLLSRTARTCVTFVYFFQTITNKEQATSISLAASILYDIFVFLQRQGARSNPQHSVSVHQVLALSSRKRRVVDVKFRELWDVVLHAASELPDFTLVIDGLDECESALEKSQHELIVELLKLSSARNARLIVLFRNHPQLETVFAGCPTIEITPEAISHDIHVYVSAEIQRHPDKLQRLEKQIRQTILEYSRGMFLWAVMIMKCLKSAETYNEQLTYLQSPPPDLYSFYENIISRTTIRLTPTATLRRREIFIILVGVYQPLTCEELSYVLSLGTADTPDATEFNTLIESENAIMRSCWPLAKVSDHRVHLIHASVRDFLTSPQLETNSPIHITSDESESYLASKCLSALSQAEYRSKNIIGILIRRNVASAAEKEEDKYFYQYAATHWFVHLVAVQDPELSLVQQAAIFLIGNEFVSWSEFIFQLSGSQGTVLEVESKLNIWRETLSKAFQDILVLDRYFSGPYRAVAEEFREDGGDKTLSYLCLFQLGAYFNLATRIEEAFEVKRVVARGLIDLLGERHPLALMAESEFAFEYLQQRRFPEAEATFRRLAQIQREVLGVDRPDCFHSLQRQGMAELWMAKFADADLCLTESLSGLINTVGVTSFLYLMSQLTLGQVLEYQGDIRRASMDYEHIWRYRREILGPDNPMAIWARCAMVSTFRKQGKYEDAEKAVLEVIDSRTRTIGQTSSSTIDAIIQRVVLCLDMGNYPEALELIEFILDGGLVDKWFERVVQVNHVRALVELFIGNAELAMDIMQSLVDRGIEKGVGGRIRSLLWVRNDLATIYRKNGRSDEAPMLFDELVTSIDSDSDSSWVEPQSPVELALAEKALKLVREMKAYDAELLLKENGLKWLRQEDFWILNGDPAADTAWMRKPYT
ncbi:uncharacterized protein K444DRAFT_388061 [Hyaloscypha bicolor E]|uniref:Uncharacterized protein n=1 Tax=Hyaloscypha bicolor E TaxID=1095630 RepID=A0A2J6TCM7_9HELO|nr:uncharacterized protein K444DRAFT_388061 [Hyaloscypha bicolor E]PMD60732.1 hypothetical protein K444DRAFT_388061 [Hyaloscypha bicolor E]